MNYERALGNIRMAVKMEREFCGRVVNNVPSSLNELRLMDCGDFFFMCKQLELSEISLSLKPQDFYRLRLNKYKNHRVKDKMDL
ncbi:hypothetical protein OAT67_08145 [Bacteriovoracaceae bacterium]|nr:hypothetical protein [Bacteriovoracaceae bacterium]